MRQRHLSSNYPDIRKTLEAMKEQIHALLSKTIAFTEKDCLSDEVSDMAFNLDHELQKIIHTCIRDFFC